MIPVLKLCPHFLANVCMIFQLLIEIISPSDTIYFSCQTYFWGFEDQHKMDLKVFPESDFKLNYLPFGMWPNWAETCLLSSSWCLSYSQSRTAIAEFFMGATHVGAAHHTAVAELLVPVPLSQNPPKSVSCLSSCKALAVLAVLVTMVQNQFP